MFWRIWHCVALRNCLEKTRDAKRKKAKGRRLSPVRSQVSSLPGTVVQGRVVRMHLPSLFASEHARLPCPLSDLTCFPTLPFFFASLNLGSGSAGVALVPFLEVRWFSVRYCYCYVKHLGSRAYCGTGLRVPALVLVMEAKFREKETVTRFRGNSRFRTESRQSHTSQCNTARFSSIIGYSVSHNSVFWIIEIIMCISIRKILKIVSELDCICPCRVKYMKCNFIFSYDLIKRNIHYYLVL